MSELAPPSSIGHLVAAVPPDLGVLADRIRERDKQLWTAVRRTYLDNGLDLIAAKRCVGHGNFEIWCLRELGYSKSKAEKLMRVAEAFGTLLKSVTVTDLPPPTLLYVLSAPSTPQAIRDEFIPRVLAKEGRIATKLKIALKEHREQQKLAERSSAKTLNKPKLQPEEVEPKADCEELEDEHPQADTDQQLAVSNSVEH